MIRTPINTWNALLLSGLLSVIANTPVRADAIYNITDLGKVVITGPGARDINQHGQVTLNLTGTGYIWDNGVLSPPGGVPNNNTSFAINDSGHLVWVKSLRGQFYDGNSITELPLLPGQESNIAVDLNNSDVVVGYLRRAGEYRAFRWDGVVTELEPLTTDGASLAYAINDSGIIVGSAERNSVPVKWVNGQIEALPLPSGMYRGVATAVNSLGQIVGFTEHPLTPPDANVDFGMLWTGTEVIALGSLNRSTGGVHKSTYPYAINDHGVIVGEAYSPSVGGNELAFIYQDGVLLDLNGLIEEPDWLLQAAFSINNAGQIVGSGRTQGETHAFLLTPVPEPSSFLLAAIGLFLVAVRCWRCRLTA